LFFVASRGWEKQEKLSSEAEAWSQALSGYELHYLDLDRVQSAEDFYRQALDKLGVEGDGVRGLERAIAGRRVVFLLDEFEKTANNPNFSPDFFSALRSLAQTGELALVIATQTPVVDLVASGAISTSPFYNIFTRLDLGPLPPDEALALLADTAALAGVTFDAHTLVTAVTLAEGHPFRLQLLGRLLFEAHQAERLDLEEVSEQFWRALEPGTAEVPFRGAISPNRSFLNAAGVFLVVAGAVGFFASLSGDLTIGVVSIGLILVGVVLGLLALLINTPVSEGS
jgi:hypothetical protein